MIRLDSTTFTMADILRIAWHIDYTNSPHGCWLWTAGRFANGYGSATTRRRTVLAHRATYFLVTGIDPGALEIAHNCPGGDNKLCVNPAHMLLLTRQEHTVDQDAKRQRPFGPLSGWRTKPERMVLGERHGSRTHPERRPRGERHYMATMPDIVVRTALTLYAAGGITQKQLAAQLGVAQTTISKWVTGRGRVAS